MKRGTRIARCPRCGHEGKISRSLRTGRMLRCSSCHAAAPVRACVGPRPTACRSTRSAASVKAAAVREILDRHHGGEWLEDDLHDLWPRNQLTQQGK